MKGSPTLGFEEISNCPTASGDLLTKQVGPRKILLAGCFNIKGPYNKSSVVPLAVDREIGLH